MPALHDHIAKDGFRLRGTHLSRVDAFSDVVFGFALTLIVVSLEVPQTYAEFHELVLSFLPFFICFVFLFMVWWAHFRFFRRYGLHDTGTILINAALLFTVLCYVYPLKFLWFLVVHQLFPGLYTHAPVAGEKVVEVFTSAGQAREMMIVYGAGYAAVYFAFAALYWNAFRQRVQLHLNELEKTLTLTYFWDDFTVACVGLVCIVAAILLPLNAAGNAGWFFFLIPIIKTVHGSISRRRVDQAKARTATHELTSPSQP
jgi:uncharacterized membrane protein